MSATPQKKKKNFASKKILRTNLNFDSINS
jgi:hypothetical protein